METGCTQILHSLYNHIYTLGIDHQERRQLVQSSRESFQDAVLKLKENQEDISLTNALKGCIIALRAAEHVAVQEGKVPFNRKA